MVSVWSAESLKLKLSRKCDLLNDSETWTDQQQLQTIYHQVLVLDLEYALDKKVEQELWTLGFKNHISALQELARDKKNPRRSDSQALLAWCLESASGFYLTLLQELCSAFNLDLPFRRKGSAFGQLKCPSTSEQIALPQSSSCLYICQYCLVHLGDIARYRNQRRQAENFYKQAIIVSPNSGHPYNQLALLEASQGDKLSTVFHYVRGIAVKNPFPATATNLSNTFSALVDKNDAITEVQTKMAVPDFIKLFLYAHGLLYSAIDLGQADLAIKSLNATLTALVATQSFTSDKLIKMTIINLYTLRHTVGTDIMNTSELTKEELRVREFVLDLLAGSLSAFLLPVYTLKDDESLLGYYALPAVKLIMYWIELQPKVLTEKVFRSRLQIWPGLCKLLNSLLVHTKNFDYSKYEKLPLEEDVELQGFLPLAEKFKEFDFKSESEGDEYVRAKRIVDFGVWLTSVDVDANKLIITMEGGERFEPGCIQPDPTDRLLEEMKSVSEKTGGLRGAEKRGGILKPQGSLEKAREERELAEAASFDFSGSSSSGSSASGDKQDAKLKRVRQNVALQSIYKKMEENKQVKFSTEIPDNEEKPLKSKPPINLPINHLSQPFRTQTFNQNHPALSSISSEIQQNLFRNPLQNRPTPQPDSRNMAANMMNMMGGMGGMGAMGQGGMNAGGMGMGNTGKGYNMMGTMATGGAGSTPQSNQFQNALNGMQYPNGQGGYNPWNTGNKNITMASGSGGWWPQNNQMGQMPQMGYGGNMFQGGNMQPYPNGNMYGGAPGNNMNFGNMDPTPWWPQNNQMPQGQNYPQMQFGGNMPYPGSNLPPYPVQGVTVDMNATPQTYANMYGGGPMTLNVGNPGGAVPNYNQGMSMRQTMLKETKQNTPGYSLFNNATWNPNLTATGGNDAGGDMDRELSTVADALEKLLGKS